MLGYNMYAYCENNPVNYVDYTGENFTSALRWWTTVIGPASMAEPTVFGEILLGAGTIILGTGALLEGAIETIETAKTIIDIALAEKAEDPPKSVTDADEVPKDVVIPDVEYPGDDPTVAPDGYEWTGPDSQGGKRGGYKNKTPGKRDSWHPDLDHPEGIDPHWDYTDVFKHKWRVFPDHIEFVY